MGDDFAELSAPEPAPEEAEPVEAPAAEPVQAPAAEPVQAPVAEPVHVPAAEPAAPAATAAPAQDERFVSAEPVAAAPAGTSGMDEKPRDARLVGETDEQGIAGAAPEPVAADPSPNPAAAIAAPAALGAASAAAAAEAAARGRNPNPVHVPRAPLPAPRLGAGPVESFAEALPRVGCGTLGAAGAVLLAVALVLSWRWTATYGPLAALPGVLLGLCAVLLAAVGWAVTEHVLPLTAPLTRTPPESIPALARNIVRHDSCRRALQHAKVNKVVAVWVTYVPGELGLTL